MGRSSQSEGEQPGQRGQSPGETTHTAAPSPWKSKDGGTLWGAVDWAFLPLGAAGPGGGCSRHGFAAAKLAVGDGLVWSHPSTARAAPAEPGKGSSLHSPKDARDPFASPRRGKFGLFLLSSPFLQAQPAGTGFSLQNLPPGSLQPGIWGVQGAAPQRGAPTMAPRVAGLSLAIGSRQAAAIARL